MMNSLPEYSTPVPCSIMLVDDDEDDQQIFLGILEKIRPDLSYCTAWNGLEALSKLRSARTLPDMIFLDLNMPLMNGFQFLEERAQNPALRNIPVIIFSTTSDKTSMQRAVQLGALRCITKPDRIELWEKELSGLLAEPVNAVSTRKPA